jgi:hypothetical protein
MKMFPALSTAIPSGSASVALVAAIPSLLYPLVPLPATVLISPVLELTRRIRLFAASAMKMFPTLSTATSVGPVSSALEAAIPSPLYPLVPLPATVLIKPVLPLTLRIRPLYSAM